MEVLSLYLHVININTDTTFTILHSPLARVTLPLPFSSASLLPSLTWPRWVFASCRRSSIESHQQLGVKLPLSVGSAVRLSHQVSSEQIEERSRHLRKEASEDVMAVAANDLRQFGILLCDNLRHFYKRPSWLIAGQQLVPARFHLQKLPPNLADPHGEVDMAVGDGTRSLPRSSNAVKERKIASTWQPSSSSRTSSGAAPWSISRRAQAPHLLRLVAERAKAPEMCPRELWRCRPGPPAQRCSPPPPPAAGWPSSCRDVTIRAEASAGLKPDHHMSPDYRLIHQELSDTRPVVATR